MSQVRANQQRPRGETFEMCLLCLLRWSSVLRDMLWIHCLRTSRCYYRSAPYFGPSNLNERFWCLNRAGVLPADAGCLCSSLCFCHFDFLWTRFSRLCPFFLRENQSSAASHRPRLNTAKKTVQSESRRGEKPHAANLAELPSPASQTTRPLAINKSCGHICSLERVVLFRAEIQVRQRKQEFQKTSQRTE